MRTSQHEATILTNMEEEDKTNNALKKLKSVKKCPYCGTQQRKLKLERPTFFYIDANKLKPDEIRDWLSKISDEDLKDTRNRSSRNKAGMVCNNSSACTASKCRPSITLESGERSEDDLTHKLVDIMRINQRLEQDIDAGAPQIIIDDLWELLQYQVTTYFNNETPGIPVARHRTQGRLRHLHKG